VVEQGRTLISLPSFSWSSDEPSWCIDGFRSPYADVPRERIAVGVSDWCNGGTFIL
jgi:hypothetical protein